MPFVPKRCLLLILMFVIGPLGQGTRAEDWPEPPVAPTPKDARTKKKVTVDFQETPLRKALVSLFKGSDLRVDVDQRIPDFPVSLQARDIAFDIVVRVIVRQTSVRMDGVTHQYKKGVYRIYIKPVDGDAPNLK